MSPQAGWYADPTDPAFLRWWDGAAWTSETRGAELVMAAAAASAVPTPTLAPAPAPVTTTVAMPAAPVAAVAPAVAVPAVAPAVAEAAVPALAGQVATAVAVLPDVAVAAEAPTPALAPTPTRAGTTAMTPTAPRTTTFEPEPLEVDRSRPGAGTAPVRAPHAPSSSTWVDESLPRTPTAMPGSIMGGHSTFGTGGGARGGFAVGPSMDFSPVGTTGEVRPSRHVGRTVTLLVLGLAVLAAFCVVAVPRYMTARAQSIAAEQPDVLARSAPATLAGAKRTRPDATVAAAARDLRGQGASWAWAATYAAGSTQTRYLASDIPLDSRGDAVNALTSHDAAADLLASVSRRMLPASAPAVLGTATEYASPVGGKVWCMTVTAAGSANGYCLWTNGKEWLAVLSTPGLEGSAGKSTLAALAQLAKITTKSGA